MAETSASAVRDKLNHVRTQVKFWLSASQRDWSDFISADLLDRAHALGPEAEAANGPLEFATLHRITAVRQAAHLFPAVEKRPRLLAGPAELIEHVGTARFNRISQVLDGEVRSIAGVCQILLAPFGLLRRRGAVGRGLAGLTRAITA